MRKRDTSIINPTVEEKTIERIMASRIIPVTQNSTASFEFEDELFYSILNQSITLNNSVEKVF